MAATNAQHGQQLEWARNEALAVVNQQALILQEQTARATSKEQEVQAWHQHGAVMRTQLQQSVCQTQTAEEYARHAQSQVAGLQAQLQAQCATSDALARSQEENRRSQLEMEQLRALFAAREAER